VVTASNEAQARVYESQLTARRQLGSLADARDTLVVADPGGQRIGSGGSTVLCLMQILNREAPRHGASPDDLATRAAGLRHRRILIIHAGGDSRRLPAYGPCGKIFIPVPGESDLALGTALFDRQWPVLKALPAAPTGAGQITVAAGDALIQFDAAAVRWADTGLTALGCPASAEAASKHGVFCPGIGGKVHLYLQKPSPAEQVRLGALNPSGQSILDIGVMNFDAPTALALLRAFGVESDRDGQLAWSEPMARAIRAHGLDFYREICCGLGEEATVAHLVAQARAAGSAWEDAELARIYGSLHTLPFHVQVLPRCTFLHFGTTLQVISSGQELREQDLGTGQPERPLSLNTHVSGAGEVRGPNTWVEGCRLEAPLTLAGRNVVVGLDVTEPLALPPGACLDVMPGRSRAGGPVYFIRPHGVGDTFKDRVEAGASFCGRPILDWTAAVGATPEDLWDASIAPENRSLWEARLFPAEPTETGYRRWLWMFAPSEATVAQRQAFLRAERYSSAEIASLADPDEFYARRQRIRAEVNRRGERCRSVRPGPL
jgi:fucokinase